MNKKQWAYLVGRAFYKNDGNLFLGLTALAGYGSISAFHAADGFSDSGRIWLGTTNGFLALYSGFYALVHAAIRGFSHSELKEMREKKEYYPLEQAERVIIDDQRGLDFLLERTSRGERQEWGTFLRAYDDKGKAIIDEILDISVGKQGGLIGEGTTTGVKLECTRANREGYRGCHHYHTGWWPRWLGAMNFSVGSLDKYKPEGWINLLTFNLPEGPEIIGFNRQHIYIPTKHSKRELVKATPQQIMEYLGG